MEKLHFDRIGKELADLVGVPGDRVQCRQLVKSPGEGAIVTSQSGSSLAEICTRVKHRGYAASKRIRIYGEEFEVVSDPFPSDGGIAVHVKSRKDSGIRTLQLPVTLLQAVKKHRTAEAA